ncbi:MAG TPA: CHASE3 domain-containing protein [Steroidobacter sp.]|uniref:CHASE3 domain-containing protein n=1 Tax=Steroidobacter sp. TaxID=1978227 RepID=UPI002EDA4358
MYTAVAGHDCSDCLQEAMVEATHSGHSSNATLNTPPAATGGVPLHVRIVIVISIALLMVNATLLIINTAATMDSHAQYARSYEIKRSLSTFQSVITAAESGQRGYLLTGQTGYLEPYYVAMRSWRTEIDKLRSLTSENAARQKDIATLEQLTAAAISRLKATISRSPQPGPNGTADVAGTERATTTMDRVRGIVDRMVAEEDARIEALRREVLRDLLVAGGLALLTTVVTVAVLIGLNKLLRKYVRDRETAENAILRANQALNEQVEQRTAELTELSQHLIRVSEEEKAKLARELHDTLGSNLTAINMDLNWIQRRLPEGTREIKERLQRVLQMLTETVELKHEVIEGLRPSHLDNLGLAFAMRSHCREFTRRTGLPCDLDVQEDFDDLDPARSIAFYRIAQESLTNIAKHAQASRVHVALAREDGGIRLRIIDDGVGVAEESLSKPKSHGIVGMRERMRQMGGKFQIRRPEEGTGTIVEAFIPATNATAISA